VFAKIALARPRQLFLVADGPRSDHPDDAELCRQTRAVVERVDWECDVRTIYSDSNLGIRRRIKSGLDAVFSEVEEAVVLEDDCAPSPSFFPFCDDMLARHRDDERIMAVSGFNPLGRSPTSFSYTF